MIILTRLVSYFYSYFYCCFCLLWSLLLRGFKRFLTTLSFTKLLFMVAVLFGHYIMQIQWSS